MLFLFMVQSFRAPLDSVVEKARGFEPPRGILHYTCHPCPPQETEFPWGGNYRPPFGNHRDTNPGQTKILKNQKKMKISKIQESIGSSHSWSSPLALDECVKQPKKTYKSPQVYDKSTYYIILTA